MRQRVHASIIYGSLTAAAICAITASTLSVSAQTIMPDQIPIPLTRPAGNANSVSSALDLISPQTRPAVIDAKP